jgi:hypothetical protein
MTHEGGEIKGNKRLVVELKASNNLTLKISIQGEEALCTRK